MEHTRTEVESHAIDAIIGSTMELDLGVRSWSNVATTISASALLYDDSWRRAYVMKTHFVAEAIKVRRIGKRGLATMIAGFAFMIICLGMSYSGVLNRFEGFAPTLAKQQGLATAAPIVTPRKSSDNIVEPKAAAPMPSPASMSIVNTVPVQSKQLSAGSAPTAVAVMAQQAKAPSPVPVREESKAPASAPSPAKPFIGKRPEDFLPPAPLPLWAGKSPLPNQEAQPEKEEKAMLAVDETKAQEIGEARQPRQIEPKTDAKSTAHESQKTKSTLVTDPTREMSVNQADSKAKLTLPAYTVLAVTADGVVITDPATRLPREIKVGKSLPNGEVVKKVSSKTSQVTTDRRILKVSE
ncbi:hypothetical protein ACFQAT_26175 [Undibacterium arcticum]|uniref:Uncharacterized protein n=1 Tax=Undibacterium arcticum TaxID=1762892 RepID=A0ABV7F843_9BURK